jgi:hypothetical protein
MEARYEASLLAHDLVSRAELGFRETGSSPVGDGSAPVRW